MVFRSYYMRVLLTIILFSCIYNQNWIASFNYGFDHLPNEYYQHLKDKKIILIGEAHFNSANPKIFYDYITKLNKEQGFTEILLELGYSEGYLLNKYLESGNDSLIRNNSFYKSDDYKKVFKMLYEYNLNLPTARKTHFIGVDFERQRSAIQAVKLLLDDLSFSNLFKEEIEGLDRIYNESKSYELEDATLAYFYEITKKLELLKMNKDEESYKNLDMILNNKASSKRMTDRNHDMMQNFKKLYNPNKKYFGQFGGVHVRLEKKFTFSNEIISEVLDGKDDSLSVIPIHYYKSNVLNGKSVKTATGGGFNFLAEINGKPTAFDLKVGENLTPGIYILNLENAPIEYTKKLYNRYSYILYVNKMDAVAW